MREDICFYVSPANRTRLERLVADRNTPRKVVWRADIVLATADGLGTMAIMRRTGKSKPCVWGWQKRFIEAGICYVPQGRNIFSELSVRANLVFRH